MPCEIIVALGREGCEQAAVDADHYPHTAAMAERLWRKETNAAYRMRKAVLGFRQFSFRGLKRVLAEWKLVCMALNLRRMAYL